jgi:hypothetical protein
MTDAVAATRARKQVAAATRSATLAARMVPMAAHEGKYVELAARLQALVFPEQASPTAAGQRAADMVPTGLPDPGKLRNALQEGVQRLQSALPRARSLASHAVVQQMIAEIVTRAAQRAAARSVKFVVAGSSALRQDSST